MPASNGAYYQQAPYKPRTGRPGRDPAEERRIVRQAMLKASVAWLTTFADGPTRPTSSDVLKLAEKFEAWVYR
jgi:hypothetical protein